MTIPVSASVRDLLTKNTGFYRLSLLSLNRAAITATFEIAKYMKSVSPTSMLTRIGGFAKYCLIWVKAGSHFLFHPARLASLRMEKNDFMRSVNRDINHPKAANRPVSCCTLFLELVAGDSKIA